MKNALIVLLVVAILGGGYYVMNNKKNDSSMQKVPVESMMEKKPETTGTMLEQGSVKEFTVDSFEMGFSVKEIKVTKGDTVKINFTNSGKYMHDWVVDEFNARTKQIKKGETDSISFVVDKTGTFEYYCSVMQHRKMGMVGKLIVEE